MSTPDFFRSRLDAMINMQHPLAVLAVLAGRLPWARIEAALAPKFTHQDRPVRQVVVGDLLGEHAVVFGGGVSNAGRPRLPIRLMSECQMAPPSRGYITNRPKLWGYEG